MTLAAAKAWMDGQMLPNYKPVAGASVTPDEQYTDEDQTMAGAFTPPTSTTHAANRVQVTSPATALLDPSADTYVGAIAGTVSGCTAGAVATPVHDVDTQVVGDNIMYEGQASNTANAALTPASGGAVVFKSPYNWKGWVADTPGAYLKGRFTKTSLTINIDRTALAAVSAAAGDYPWIAVSIDGGAFVRTQVPNGAGTVGMLIATGLANATHTFLVFYEHHNLTQDTWGTQSYTLRLDAATQFVVDSGASILAPASLNPRTLLVYGASIEQGYNAAVTAPTIRASTSWLANAAAGLQCEFGFVGEAGQGYVNEIGSGFGPFGVPNLESSYSKHFDNTTRLVAGVLSPVPDIVLITMGTNDQPYDPDAGTGYTDAFLEAGIYATLAGIRAIAGSAKIIASIDTRGNRKVAIAAAVAAYVAATSDANTFYADPGQGTVAILATGGNTTDGLHPTPAGSLLLVPIMRHAVLGTLSLNGAYQLVAYQHTDTYSQRTIVPIDEAGGWQFTIPNNAGGEWRCRVKKISDGSQQGAEWTPSTFTFLKSGIVLEAYKYTDSYYRIQSPEQPLERAYTDVLIDPAGDLTLGFWSIDSLGFPGEWRFRPLNDTTHAQAAPEWQGVNGNHDIYTNLELRFVLVNDRDYMVNRQLASTSNRWYWKHAPGRRGVRLHFVTDDEGSTMEMPAPRAEWTMTTGLPRSTVLGVSDPGYGTRSEDLAFTYNIALAILVYVSYSDWATAQKICLGLCDVQFSDGPFPFAVFQRYSQTFDRYVRTGGGVMHPGYALAKFKQLAPKSFQDPRIDAAITKIAAYGETIADPITGLIRGGEGVYWPAWAPSTFYALADRRVNGGKTYECTLGGVSASSGGPTGTGGAIVDNAAHWKWIVSSELDPIAVTYCATEHNVGAWRFYNLMYTLYGRKSDQIRADAIRHGMLQYHWNEVGGYLYQSSTNGTADGVTTLDSGSWGGITLIDWGETAKATRAITRLDNVPPGYVVTYAGHTGYRTFSGDDGIFKTGGGEYAGLWPEGTFGVAFAKHRLGLITDGDAVVAQMVANQDAGGGFKYLMTADSPDIPQTYLDMAGPAWFILDAHRDITWSESIAVPQAGARYDHSEIRTDLECNDGIVLTRLPAASSIQINRSIVEASTVTAAFARFGDGCAEIQSGRIFLMRYDDGSAEEWRISQISYASGSDGSQTVSLTATHPLMDLAEWDLLREVSADGIVRYDLGFVNLTPLEYLVNVFIPGAPTFTALGRVDIDIELSLQFSRASIASAIDTMIKAITTQRIPAEWDWRRVGDATYALDVVNEIGEEAEIIELRVGAHITLDSENVDATSQTTKVIGFGMDGATIAHAAFPIMAIVGLVLTIEDGDGIAAPILEDGQLDNLYIVHPHTGALVHITASHGPTPSTITVASAAGLTVGDWVEFRADAAGTQLQALTIPGTRTKLGTVEDDTLTGGRNLVANAFGDDWTGGDDGPPDGYAFDNNAYNATITGFADATIAREVGPPDPDWGGVNIAHIRSVYPWCFYGLGTAGYKSKTAFWATAGVGERYSVRVRIWINSIHSYTLAAPFQNAQIRVTLEDESVSDEIDRYFFPVAEILADIDTATGQWVDLNIENIELPRAGLYRIRVTEWFRQPGVLFAGTRGTLDFYVGPMQFTSGANIVPYVDGSHDSKIWHFINYQLSNNRNAVITYNASIVDHARLDPDKWGQLALTRGGTCRVINEEAGTRRLMRCVAFIEDPIGEQIIKATFSTQRSPMTLLLAQAIAGVT